MTYAARSRSPFPTSFSRFGLNSNSIERPPHDGWIVRQGVRTRLLCGGRAPKAVRAYGPSPSWAPDSIRYLVQRSELRAPVIIQVRAKRGSAGVFSHRAKEADVSEAETARKEKEGGRKGVSRCKGRSIWFRFAESGDWQLHERLIRTPKEFLSETRIIVWAAGQTNVDVIWDIEDDIPPFQFPRKSSVVVGGSSKKEKELGMESPTRSFVIPQPTPKPFRGRKNSARFRKAAAVALANASVGRRSEEGQTQGRPSFSSSIGGGGGGGRRKMSVEQPRPSSSLRPFSEIMDAAHEQEVADALVQKRIGLEHQLEQVEHTYSEIEELARASMESYQAAAAELIAEQESAELGRIASLEAQIAATQRQSAEQNRQYNLTVQQTQQLRARLYSSWNVSSRS